MCLNCRSTVVNGAAVSRTSAACQKMVTSRRSSNCFLICVFLLIFFLGLQEAAASEVKLAVHNAYENAIQRPRFSYLSVSRCPLPIPLPFPSIFGNLVGQQGELLGTPNSGPPSRGLLDVHSIPMAARLRSSSAILPFLDRRLYNLRRFGIQQGALGSELLRGWGFGKDELEDMGESLSKMVATLNPRSEISSDSD